MSQITIYPAVQTGLPVGSATAANQTLEIAQLTAINSNTSVLASGATAANQVTEISKLTSIDGKTPALGQALAAASIPVVLTAAQLSTLTPLSSVSISNFPATQPVSGTVTANAGTGTFAVSAASLPLPTGAATSALQSTINTTLGSPFQAGGSIGNTSFASTQSGTWNITNISGTVSLPTGAATAAKQPALGTAGTASSDVITIQGIASMTAISTTETTSGTGTITSVSGSATSVTVLASNANRKNAAFYNDSTATLYLALTSSAASTTAYTIQLPSNGYYELPIGKIYTGAITGIWSSAAGAVRVTELT